jgi:putative nucleotidyltransferase with HDIG domain
MRSLTAVAGCQSRISKQRTDPEEIYVRDKVTIGSSPSVSPHLLIRNGLTFLQRLWGRVGGILFIWKLSFTSLRSKVCFLVLSLLCVTTVVSYFATVAIMRQSMLDEVTKRATSLSRNIAAVGAYSLLSNDLLGLDNIVYKSKNSNRDVEYITILDTDMRALVHSESNMRGKTLKPSEGSIIEASEKAYVIREVKGPAGSLFEVACPIVFMDKQLGLVLVGINRSALEKAQVAVRNRMLIMFAIVLVCGGFGCLAISSTMTSPIKALSMGIVDFKNGKESAPLIIQSRDELGILTANFNEMSSLITQQRNKLNEYAEDLEESYVSMVKVVAAAIDARDPYTHGHSLRVAQLSLLIAKELGFNEEELADLEKSCLFHDVGKIRIPDAILRKTSKLSPSEYEEIMQHPDYGAEILSKAPSLHRYIPSVRHHHEWFNGQGYPDRLSGEEIPLFAAIISIADAYDAMTSERPYRKALSRDEALQEVSNSSGTQFNPRLSNIFVSFMENCNHTMFRQDAQQND